ncbi:MAG: aldose 1-epimerase family protein [Synergistaceae bacterium]|nr:aldose 1-epimerase family protein [Synergistaceae bacterium]
MYHLRIENSFISVQISETGGEITSVRGADGVEYIWQGDATYWAGRSPHLFPVIGRMFGDKYTLSGKTYKIGRHGFFRHREMRLAECGVKYLMLRMDSDEDTYKEYPYKWDAELEYSLDGPTLRIAFRVTNLGRKKMYFAYGGHPGFFVPLSHCGAFEDYYLQFEPSASPFEIGLSPNGLVDGRETEYALNKGNRLHMRRSLFNNDTLILRDAGESIMLKSNLDPHSVTVGFPQSQFLAIWQAPRTDAPYLCVEPWTSLPGREGVVENLAQKEDMICLNTHCTYQNDWTLTFA